MDFLTKKERSKRMSLIRSKWTKQERKVHNILKGRKVKHKMHPKLIGNPDILLTATNTVIFLQGCFWHKCLKCYKEPKSNKRYWLPKIENNVTRDVKNTKILKSLGFKVVKVWEHEVNKEINKLFEKIPGKTK